MAHRADGAKILPVKSSLHHVDRTPPVFQAELAVTGVKETAVPSPAALTRPETVYWVAVCRGRRIPQAPVGSLDRPTLQRILNFRSFRHEALKAATTVKANTDSP